jgi:hypothetical protein
MRGWTARGISVFQRIRRFAEFRWIGKETRTRGNVLAARSGGRGVVVGGVAGGYTLVLPDSVVGWRTGRSAAR